MATLPPVTLGVILFLTFLAVLLLRKPFEKYFVLPAAEPANCIQDAVITSLRNFQGGAPQEDDITLVTIKLLQSALQPDVNVMQESGI